MSLDSLYQLIPSSVRKSGRRWVLGLLQKRMQRHFSQFISPGALVFDVGANIGDLTQIFLDLDSSVVAIDPHPYCNQVLRQRFGDNDNVTILTTALSDEPGILPFFASVGNHATSTVSQRWKEESRYAESRDWAQAGEVTATTLDDLMGRYGRPQFCKIDVEGHELQVLQGLSAPIPALSFELTGEFMEEAERCAAYLEQLGPVRFAYSPFLLYRTPLRNWTSRQALFDKLRSYPRSLLFGDIYVRFEDER
jgi:FkbM family methyltransferase